MEERTTGDTSKSRLSIIFAVVAIAMSIYQLYTSYRPIFSPIEHSAIHLGFALSLVFLSGIAAIKATWKRRAVDFVLLAGALTSVAYILISFERLVNQIGSPTTGDMVIGCLLLLVVIEATRRTFGIALPILLVVSILYARFGYIFSGFFYHAGFDTPRLIASLTTNLTGVFGSILDVSATFIVLFMIFGGLLDASGAGRFFINFAMALGGKMRSGPAQAAVISSGLVGSINGSAVANVVTTGVFTIPLMKNRGYKPEFAAAVESVASTGGMIMPPIMGVAAFVMSGITGIPYWTIALAALIPALLYYFSAGMTVHLRALKNGFEPLPEDQVPKLGETLKEGGHFLIPLISIIYFMAKGTSVMRAGFNGIVILLAVFVIRESINNPKFIISKKFWTMLVDGLINGAKSAMGVASACAAMGVMAQAVVISGLAFKIVFLIKDLSGGQGLIALILTTIVSLFFGMGVPTTASYLLVAVIGAPAIIELGFSPLAVHLFIYYYAILANITPPVCSAVLVASQIAGANYYRTGLNAIKIGLPGFILPYLFVYHNELLLQGPVFEILTTAFSAFVGVAAMSAFFEGYLMKRTSILERALLAIAAATLIYPGLTTDIIGYVCFAFVIANQWRVRKKESALTA